MNDPLLMSSTNTFGSGFGTARTSLGAASLQQSITSIHQRLAHTRDQRSLERHGDYERTWQSQTQKSIQVRDSLRGKVNSNQKVKDLTISEKVDGEYLIVS